MAKGAPTLAAIMLCMVTAFGQTNPPRNAEELFILVLASRHSGFSDVCLPNQCSMISDPSGKLCVPTIWNLIDGRYRSVKYTPVESPK